MKAKPQIDFPDDFRSYIVLAQTVQTPLHVVDAKTINGQRVCLGLAPMEGTRNIVQVGGRLAAQVGHIVDIITTAMLKKYIYAHTCQGDELLLSNPPAKYAGFWTAPPTPTTRIVKIARDSFELNHVHQLLLKAGIATHRFEDTNDDVYGPGRSVTTVIGTEPIHKEETIGLIDYLPLWDPEGLGKVPRNL